MPVKIGYDANDIITALRRRHPAYEPGYVGVGRWVTTCEWEGIDLLALDAWRSAHVIGYEVKVSRSDLRHELLRPHKRVLAVNMTTRFYIAIPAGLMSVEEKAFQEPLDWTPDDFVRPRCPGAPAFGPPVFRHGTRSRPPEGRPAYGGQCVGAVAKGSRFGRRRVQPYTISVPVPIVPEVRGPGGTYELDNPDVLERRIAHDAQRAIELHGTIRIPCPTCGGKGYTATSRVEREAPTLWVPNDVGLIEVDGSGCRVVREAPSRVPDLIIKMAGVPKETEAIAARLQCQSIAQLVRWVSARPDPRHAESYSDRMRA